MRPFKQNVWNRIGKFIQKKVSGCLRLGKPGGNGRVIVENVLELWERSYNSVNILKTIDLFTPNEETVWYVEFIKLLYLAWENNGIHTQFFPLQASRCN